MRFLRALGRGFVVLVAIVVFVAALFGAVALHLDTPAARRIVARELSALLDGTLAGSVVIEEIDSLSLSGAAGVDGRVLHPDGEAVMAVEGLRVDFDALLLLSSIFSKEPIDVHLPALTAEALRADLSSAGGSLRIAEAFASADPTPDPSGRDVRVAVDRIVIESVRASGYLASASAYFDAEIDELEGSLVVAPEQLDVVVDRARVWTREGPRGIELDLTVSVDLTMPLEDDPEASGEAPTAEGRMLDIAAEIEGFVADARISAKALVQGDHLHGYVLAPSVSPDVISDVAPEAPSVGAPVMVLALIGGTFDRPEATVFANAGPSRLRVRASVQTEPMLSAHVEAVGRQLDAALVGGPESSVSLEASADVRLPEQGGPRVSFEMSSEPGVVADVPLPAISATGELAGDELHVEAEGREPGVALDVVADIIRQPGGPRISFVARGSPIELNRLERRGVDLRGTLRFDAEGELDLAANAIRAEISATGTQLAQPGAPFLVASAELEGSVRGELPRPHLRGKLIARGIVLAGRSIRSVAIEADGPALQPRVAIEVLGEDLPQVDATTRLDLRDGLAFDDVDVALRRDGTTARARANRIQIDAGIPEVRALTITGLGEPTTLSLERTPSGGVHVEAASEDLSLQSLATIVGAELPVENGRGSFDVDLRVDPRTTRGHLELRLRDAIVRQQGERVAEVDVLVEATFLGQRAIFHVAADAPSVGEVRAYTTNLWRLAGPPTDIDSWTKAVGGIDLHAAVALGPVSRLLPSDALPFHDVSGTLELDARVGRDERRTAPWLELDLETDELVIIGKAPPEEVARDATPGPGWVLRGIDFALQSRCDSTAEHVSLSGTASDRLGTLVEVDLAADLPYERLFDAPDEIRWLAGVPLSVHVAVPRRVIGELPAFLPIPELPGEMALDARMTGTLEEPEADLVAGIYGVSLPSLPGAPPLTAKVSATYDGSHLHSEWVVDQALERILTGEIEAEAELPELVLGDPAAAPWTASADVRLGPFPLQIIQPLLNGRMKGNAYGRLRLERLHEDADLLLELDAYDLTLAGIPYEHAAIEVHASGGELTAGLEIAHSDGSLEGSIQTGLEWGARLVPELRAKRELEAVVDADSFRLGGIQPFASSVFDDLDGRLDGSIRVSEAAVRAGAETAGVTGQLRLTQGEIELVAGGGPLSNVRGRVIMEEGGILRLKDVHARGVTGEIRAEGIARIGDGTIQEAKLNAVIPDGEPMPVLAEGQHLADVSGVVNASAGWAGDGRVLRVQVDVRKLDVILPESLPEGVRKLEPMERMRVGTVRSGRFIPLALDAPDPVEKRTEPAFVTVVEVELRDVEIVRGDMLEARLVGSPRLVADGELELAGEVRLTNGWIDIKGRLFEIERGTITFTNNPTENPDVNVTAKWEAGDGTIVYADYVGPLQTGEVTLRSNPPLSEQEIVSLVVFGSAEGFNPGEQRADGSTQAVGLAGSFATSGLNKVLDDVTSLDIRTRVDTSSGTNPRPELSLQVFRNLALEISYVLGELPPGRPPDKTFATLDWNFRPEWSLETTLGDKGSSTVDLVWEHVY